MDMKKAILFLILFICTLNLFSQTIIGKPIKIGILVVAQHDFPDMMNWLDAKSACDILGTGWRLPTKDELNILYQNRDKIGGFANSFYWSATENSNYGAWVQFFNYGRQYANDDKNEKYNVRAVRFSSGHWDK